MKVEETIQTLKKGTTIFCIMTSTQHHLCVFKCDSFRRGIPTQTTSFTFLLLILFSICFFVFFKRPISAPSFDWRSNIRHVPHSEQRRVRRNLLEYIYFYAEPPISNKRLFALNHSPRSLSDLGDRRSRFFLNPTNS